MPTPLASAILHCFRRNGLYALRLVEDLTDAQMIAQPIAGRTLNHAAWVLSHVNIYNAMAASIARARPFTDPSDHPHGKKSKPLPDAAAYLPRAQLIAAYRDIHADAHAALEAATEAVLAQPNPLDRKRADHPTVGDMLVMLMVKHESVHLGQLSAWRRALGLPSVAM